MVEVMRDVAIRLLPIDEDTARDMIRSLRGAPLLDAFRGRPARDVDAVVRGHDRAVAAVHRSPGRGCPTSRSIR